MSISGIYRTMIYIENYKLKEESKEIKISFYNRFRLFIEAITLFTKARYEIISEVLIEEYNDLYKLKYIKNPFRVPTYDSFFTLIVYGMLLPFQFVATAVYKSLGY